MIYDLTQIINDSKKYDKIMVVKDSSSFLWYS